MFVDNHIITYKNKKHGVRLIKIDQIKQQTQWNLIKTSSMTKQEW